MTKLALLIAATLTFAVVFWVIQTEIEKKTDFMKAPPSEALRSLAVMCKREYP